MNRNGLTFSALVVCAVVLIAVELVGPSPALAVDCPHPGLTGVTAAPASLIGGSLSYTVTLSFAGVIPDGCLHFYTAASSNPQAVNAGVSPSNFFGDGTSQKTLTGISKVVDQTETVTLTYQARQTQLGSPVGNAVSTTVTNTPVALRSLSVSPTQLSQGQTATGTVHLENIVKSLSGSARVNLSANPSAAVQIPSSIQISCCATDGQGHSQGTFSIAARPVAQDTQVVISASRPNQTAITRTITVKTGTPTLSVNDVTVNEPVNITQTVNATFTFTLSNLNPAGASVRFVMSNITAARCQGKSCDGTGDYVLKGGVLDFGPTQTTQTVSVPICHDTQDEQNETFQIQLSNPVGLILNDTVAIGTIVDND